MKRLIALLAVSAGAGLLGACHHDAHRYDLPDNAPQIDLASAPHAIDEAVRALAISSAVQIVSINTAEDTSAYKNGKSHPYDAGSGVLLSDHRTIMSAGHLNFGDDGVRDHTCAQNAVRVTTINEDPTHLRLYPGYGVEFYSADSKKKEAGADVMALDIGDQSGLGLTLAGVSIRQQSLAPGEPVYFVNYQSDEAGKLRDHSDDAPAEYIGIVGVADKKPDAFVPILTGINDAGSGTPDIYSRPGGSGGEVLDMSGQLVGILLNVQLTPTGMTEKLLEYYMGVHLVNGTQQDIGSNFHVSEIMPVTNPFFTAAMQQVQAGTAALCS